VRVGVVEFNGPIAQSIGKQHFGSFNWNDNVVGLAGRVGVIASHTAKRLVDSSVGVVPSVWRRATARKRVHATAVLGLHRLQVTDVSSTLVSAQR